MFSAYKLVAKVQEALLSHCSPGHRPTAANCLQLRKLEMLGKTQINATDQEQLVLLQRLWLSFYPDAASVESCIDDSLSHAEQATGVESSEYHSNEFAMPSPLWKRIGFQREDPVSDIRGGGELSLRCLLFFSTRYPSLVKTMSERQRQRRRTSGMQKGYPWAAAGINVSRMVAECFEIIGPMGSKGKYSESHRHYWPLLCGDGNSDTAEENTVVRFAEVFCVAFQLVDETFIASDSGYMQFNAVLTECKGKLQSHLNQKSMTDVTQLRQVLGLPEPHKAVLANTSTDSTPVVEVEEHNDTADLLGLSEWSKICDKIDPGTTKKVLTSSNDNYCRNSNSRRRTIESKSFLNQNAPRTFVDESGHIRATTANSTDFWSEYGLTSNSGSCSAQANLCAASMSRTSAAV